MPIKKQPKQCKNPDCANGTFIPNHGNRNFCDDECKEHFNNQKKKLKKQTIFEREEKIRKNHQVLELLYQYPPHRTGVDLTYLEHLGVDIFVFSDMEKNSKTGQSVKLSHGYGIELIAGSNPYKFLIHKRQD